MNSIDLSRKQFVCQRTGEKDYYKSLQATVEACYTFGAKFLQIDQGIWSGIMLYLMLRNTNRCLSITEHNQVGV